MMVSLMASNSFNDPPSTTKVYFETMVAKQSYSNDSKMPKLAIIVTLILCSLFLLSRPFGLANAILPVLLFFAIATPLILIIERDRNIPFSVNFNHPLMSDEPMGKAQVFVWLPSDKKWVLLQEERVRLATSPLLGGLDLVYDDEDYTRIGHFTNKKKTTTQLRRSIALLNQAIILANLCNDEDAEESSITDDSERRQREKQESELLQRSWLEDEQEIEVEGPLAKFLNRE
jgi:hypothetical protein